MSKRRVYYNNGNIDVRHMVANIVPAVSDLREFRT